jgi:ribonuclease-3
MDHPVSEPPSEAAPMLESLQEALGYRFRNDGLLALALSILTPPLTSEAAAARQRLEFLGDAAWNFALATAAYQAYPHAAPGGLTRLRAAWSSRTGLSRLAKRLGLPVPMITPLGASQRVLAELLEAVLGAMVEDGGWDAVRTLANGVIAETGEIEPSPILDAKSALQMAALARGEKLPSYRLVERRGPAHHPTFRVAVTVCGPAGEIRTEAEGSSRQAAEQEAARLALVMIEEFNPPSHNIS